jgi:hypothetical protein
LVCEAVDANDALTALKDDDALVANNELEATVA